MQRLSFDLHNSVGLFASLFLFLFAVTGIYMARGPPAYAITSQPETQPASSMPQVGLKPVSLDLVATAAKDALPGDRLSCGSLFRASRVSLLVEIVSRRSF